MSLATAKAQDGGAGITQRTVFPAFNPHAAACNSPPALAKVLAFVQENNREFLQGVDHGLAMAAKDRRLEYRRVLADNDAAKAAEEIQAFRRSKVGALVATSSDPTVVRHSLQEVIWSGGFKLAVRGLSDFPCMGRFTDHAWALVKRSPKRMANWALAMVHSRGGMIHWSDPRGVDKFRPPF